MDGFTGGAATPSGGLNVVLLKHGISRQAVKARLPVSIYHPCAIRGDAAGELSPDLVRELGPCLGRQLPPAAKFVVGGDVRASTPAFLAALVEGLCQAGLDVVDLGLLPTPMIYYAQRRLAADRLRHRDRLA